jgi:tripartite-type tricarboxylate transporter receptor subunit TctC
MNNTLRVSRRAVLAAAASILLPLQATAQSNWPSKPIKLVVPFAPGGSNDNIARVIADKLATRLGQSIVIENRGGAGGAIGTELVAKSKPDGYTLLLASTSIVTNAASGKKLSYDVVKDLTPVGSLCAGPFAVVVTNGLKATTLQELIKLARAKPRSITYGSAGIGGLNHFGTELLAHAAGLQLVHVPYKGISPAFNDLMAGNLDLLLPSLVSAVAQIHGGKMRGLAVTSAQRSPLAPELPTVSEAGIPGFTLEAWWGLMGPAGLPAETVRRLNGEVNAILAQPDVVDLMAREGNAPKPGTPDDFAKLIRSELDQWGRLVKSANIRID